ncbi:MAG: T9SS type A sorting domain-containing protein, partial [Bacteroidetes bacterium]|nr:T9SS type A sorting domain-containing protein [Bacteroidota bacterium]
MAAAPSLRAVAVPIPDVAEAYRTGAGVAYCDYGEDLRDAIAAFWPGAARQLGITRVALATVDLQPLGDGAYEIGRATLTLAGGQQAVYATAYGDLILRNAGTKTFGTGETSIARNLLVDGGAVADALRNSSLLHYNGASGQLLPAIDHFDLQLSNTGTKVFGTGTTGVFRQFISEPGAKLDTRTNQSVIFYNGDALQIVAPLQYYTLRLGNTGSKQFSEGITSIAASLQVSEAASADARTRAASIHYNGADQLLYPMAYHHLALVGTGTKVFDAGTTHIAGALNIAAIVATDALTRSSTLHFDGAGSQTIPAMDYYSLQSSLGIARSLGTDGTIRISGSFAPGAAEYNTAGSRVEFNGSQAQNIPVLPYHTLIINNTSGATAQGNINIAEALTFMAGNLHTGSHTLHLATGARLNNERNTHYVLGHVQLAQPIGTGASNFGNMGLAIAAGPDDLGTVTVKRTTGAAITKNGEAGISRIWDISTGGIQPVSGRDLTFSWLQADDNANNLENLQVWRSKSHLADDWERVGALQAAAYDQDSLRSVSVNTDHFSLWTVGSDDLSTLPVAMLYFKGQRMGQHQVKLHWATAKEDSNYGFEVERSEDGRSYVKIGFVPGKGTTIHRQSYTFSDGAAAQGAYYRLKQLDYDGVSEISKVIYLPYLQEEALKAYPNPARHYIIISGGSAIVQDGEVLDALLFSVQGVEVVRCSGSLASINGQINEHLPALSAGIYYLTVRNGDRQSMVKLVIY